MGSPFKPTALASQQGSRMYLESTDDQERVDAMGVHLSSDVLQVLPGEGAGDGSREERSGRTPLVPHPPRLSCTALSGRGMSAPSSTLLVDRGAGEPHVAERPAVRSQKRVFSKEKGKKLCSCPTPGSQRTLLPG